MKKPKPKTRSKQETMSLTAFTRGGLSSLLASYRKMGCEPLDAPRETSDGTARWTMTITKPVFQEI